MAELIRDPGARLEGEVRFDAGSRALYATDASNYRQVPIGVLIPAAVDDVVETVAACCRALHTAEVLQMALAENGTAVDCDSR